MTNKKTFRSLSPEAAAVNMAAITLERELVFGAAKSRPFYLQLRERICPYNEKTGKHRGDFSTNRYNYLFQAIDAHWRRYDQSPPETELPISTLVLMACVVDQANNKHISVADALELQKEIVDESPLYAEITHESSMALLQSAGFTHWLKTRLMAMAFVKISADQELGNLTLDTLFDACDEAQKCISVAAGDGPKLLGELKVVADDDPSVLIGPGRFLYRGGLLLVVGSTGIGKSTLTLQMVILFALGRECFGFRPNGRLRILLVQAENDEGEIAEFRDGIFNGLQLSEDDRKAVGTAITVKTSGGSAGKDFASRILAPLLASCRPDLVLIDPALAYLGGDSSDQADVGRFLRSDLTPVLQKFKCGCLLTHHSNKPGKDQTHRQGADTPYFGSGSAEYANVARGVITLNSTNVAGVYELSVPKRGGRLGWKEDDDVTPTTKRYVKHSTKPGEICWKSCTFEEVSLARAKLEAQRDGQAEATILKIIQEPGEIEKNDLLAKAKAKDITRKQVEEAILALMAGGQIREEKRPRPKARPAIWYIAGINRNDGNNAQVIFNQST